MGREGKKREKENGRKKKKKHEKHKRGREIPECFQSLEKQFSKLIGSRKQQSGYQPVDR